MTATLLVGIMIIATLPTSAGGFPTVPFHRSLLQRIALRTRIIDQFAVHRRGRMDTVPPAAPSRRRSPARGQPVRFGPPSDELVHAIVAGTSPARRALDADIALTGRRIVSVRDIMRHR